MKKTLLTASLLICTIASASSIKLNGADQGIISSCAYMIQNYNLNQPNSPTVKDQCKLCITKTPTKRTKKVIEEMTKQCVEKVLSNQKEN